MEQQRGFFLSANHPEGRRGCSPTPGGQEGHRAPAALAHTEQQQQLLRAQGPEDAGEIKP